jgi:predicted membrane protein (TIGR00267 family)
MRWDDFKRVSLHVGRARGITRRYFVTNGFDGALTMMGLIVGFRSTGNVTLPIAITACLSAAVALCMSGLSSAYLSETAERKKELQDLEQALLSDLSKSDYGKASRFVPILVAMVNGLSPLGISLIIITPLWLAESGIQLPFPPFLLAISIALFIILMLGVMLGRLSNEFWLWTGLRTLAIAGLTMLVILSFNI